MSGSRSSSSGRSSYGISGRGRSTRRPKISLARFRWFRRLNPRWQFLIGFLLWFAVAFGIWYLAVPIINVVLSFVVERVVFLADTHNLTQAVEAAGYRVMLRYSPSPDGQPLLLRSRVFTFNTVFLLALIMAVPKVEGRLRLKILVLGLAFLFPIQVLHLTVYIFNYYGQHMKINGESFYPVPLRKALYYAESVMIRVNGQMVPVAIWAGLFFYYRWHRQYFARPD